ncbi:MAG: sulfur carrier protein [Cellvibrionaceae bacterium]
MDIKKIKIMVKVTLNGEEKEIDKPTSLEDAITSWSLGSQSFAVAVNEQFIPKGYYASTQLQENDRVELLVPMQGG